jgi:hypothetical protein
MKKPSISLDVEKGNSFGAHLPVKKLSTYQTDLHMCKDWIHGEIGM